MMTKLSEFVNEILMANGWNTVSNPSALTESWEAFIKECEEGYSWTIYEYDNEIRVREKMELILASPEIQTYEEIQNALTKVNSLDARMRSLFIPNISRKNKNHWWDKGVLKYAGEEYAKDIKHELNIEVNVV